MAVPGGGTDCALPVVLLVSVAWMRVMAPGLGMTRGRVLEAGISLPSMTATADTL